MKKNKVIILSYFLPGYKVGGPLVSILSLVKRLSDVYDFKVITPDRDFGDETPYQSIQTNRWVDSEYAKVFYVKKDFFTIFNILNQLKKHRSPEKAVFYPRFFKTGKGQYGEGDKFWGVTVPDNRSVAKKYFALCSLEDFRELLQSPIHEVRLCALIMMVYRYESKKLADMRKDLYNLYINHTAYINNWDLVDSSAAQIVGGWLEDKKKDILYRWAQKGHLWEQRIAILSTFHCIRKGQFEDTIAICKLLLAHEHDLIHKATGWMLREVGKRNHDTLLYFLAEHHGEMPRTMLRYSIEKLDTDTRKRILLNQYF